MTSFKTVEADQASVAAQFPVAIVGAGFGGICTAIQLIRAGFTDITIYDAASDIGGTWSKNTYPGCACDVPSVLYCFSFEPYHWTEHFSSQPQILSYLRHCVNKYSLEPHIKLGTRITAAAFDETMGMWVVTAADGQRTVARMLVLAQGVLSCPGRPSVPGLDSFSGAAFHSAEWDHSCDLTGKRVAVVGTGASAIQIIPKVQPLAKELYVFQRTPAWVFPRSQVIPSWASTADKCSRLSAKLQRWYWYMFNELMIGWPMITRNASLRRLVGAASESVAKKTMHRQIEDPELREKLTPSYAIGCKRVLMSDDYYAALAQPNVRLVASAVKEVINSTTIVGEDGTAAEVDVIIFATGFNLQAPYHNLHVTGPGGRCLADALSEKPAGYLGIAVAGFPNLFTVTGPHTVLGSNSVLFMIECAANCIVKFASWMAAKGWKFMEIKQELQLKFTAEMHRRLKGTVWLSGGCSSWYLDGKGGSWALWPGLSMEYKRRTGSIKPQDFTVVEGEAKAELGDAKAAGVASADAVTIAAQAAQAGEVSVVAGYISNGSGSSGSGSNGRNITSPLKHAAASLTRSNVTTCKTKAAAAAIGGADMV